MLQRSKMKKSITNEQTSLSIKQKILNQAKISNRPFQELLQYYVMERFLYRLSVSEYKNNYILKGALMLRVWKAPESRPTKDIDLLGQTPNHPENIQRQMRTILVQKSINDGLRFDPDSIQTKSITEHNSYEGLRLHCWCYLGRTRVRLRIDIGFGDIVFPETTLVDFPPLLDIPHPKTMIRGYSRESVISEKTEVILSFGMLNSRMKDYYDIWFLSRHFSFQSNNLSQAIQKTCRQRETKITIPVIGLSQEFASFRQDMWTAFRKRNEATAMPKNFSTIIEDLTAFLMHVLGNTETTIHTWQKNTQRWMPKDN